MPHPTGAKFIRYNLPVTIQCMFANGRDHPVWSVTWDWSAVPVSLPLAEQIEGDSRGPYGEMDFDGVASSPNLIGGVAWAVNEKRFTTGSAPFTRSSAWTWNTRGSATIPYNLLWIHNGNAQMGMVQTILAATATVALFTAAAAPPSPPATRAVMRPPTGYFACGTGRIKASKIISIAA